MQERAPAGGRFGWDRLVAAAGVVVVALLVSAAAGFRDVEAAAFAVGTIVALVLVRTRARVVALVALGVLFADVTGWMLPGAFVNVAHHAQWIASALPATLGTSALAGLVAVAAVLWRIRRPFREHHAPLVVAVSAIANVAGAASESNARHVARGNDIVVRAQGVKFSKTTLEAPPGRVGVLLTNWDLFWHTFTIPRLHVNLQVPVGGEERVEFDAPPGTYEFMCTIPGHAQAGMRGTLVVR